MAKKVTISMPDGLLQLIDEEVSRGHTSRSALMREAVRLYLGEQSISRRLRSDSGANEITEAIESLAKQLAKDRKKYGLDQAASGTIQL